ncbi:MAG TPA: MerR family transcriptional regulator [Ktedonobacteraceae bacterium]|nr:MerR family transcriptional regulator [Ktedonobacteraceae bacterium]
MQEDTPHLTIEELAERVDIPVRTVRYYITEGLLPGPEGRGKATTYSEEHLQRLRLIRLLSNQHRPLAEIHQLLNRLSLAEVKTLLAEEEQRARELEPAGQPPQPREYIAALLRNAQASRLAAAQSAQVSPPAPAPASRPPGSSRSVTPGQKRVRESSSPYRSVPATSPEGWQRWLLAPGVELHVREGAEEQQRDLLERLLRAADMFWQEEEQ